MRTACVRQRRSAAGVGRSRSAASGSRAGRACALLLLFSFLFAGLLKTPTAFTQDRTRPRRTSQPTKTPNSKTTAARDAAATSDAQQQKDEGGAQRQTEHAKQDTQEVGDDEVVTINASEVLLPVTVRDASGQLVTDLTRKDFRVFEDGREQPLSDLSLRQVPVDVALLVDASSSVAESFEDFRRAADEFAARLDREDRFCLVKFDDRVELLLDWSKSRLQLRRALSRLTTGVFTRFNDALLLSAREQFQRNERRRALVVLSDGIDSNRGAANAEAAMRALLEAQVAVYVISNTEIERARKQSELDGLLAGPDSSVRFTAMRTGQVDVMHQIQSKDVAAALAAM